MNMIKSTLGAVLVLALMQTAFADRYLDNKRIEARFRRKLGAFKSSRRRLGRRGYRVYLDCNENEIKKGDRVRAIENIKPYTGNEIETVEIEKTDLPKGLEGIVTEEPFVSISIKADTGNFAGYTYKIDKSDSTRLQKLYVDCEGKKEINVGDRVKAIKNSTTGIGILSCRFGDDGTPQTSQPYGLPTDSEFKVKKIDIAAGFTDQITVESVKWKNLSLWRKNLTVGEEVELFNGWRASGKFFTVVKFDKEKGTADLKQLQGVKRENGVLTSRLEPLKKEYTIRADESKRLQNRAGFLTREETTAMGNEAKRRDQEEAAKRNKAREEEAKRKAEEARKAQEKAAKLKAQEEARKARAEKARREALKDTVRNCDVTKNSEADSSDDAPAGAAEILRPFGRSHAMTPEFVGKRRRLADRIAEQCGW